MHLVSQSAASAEGHALRDHAAQAGQHAAAARGRGRRVGVGGCAHRSIPSGVSMRQSTIAMARLLRLELGAHCMRMPVESRVKGWRFERGGGGRGLPAAGGGGADWVECCLVCWGAAGGARAAGLGAGAAGHTSAAVSANPCLLISQTRSINLPVKQLLQRLC